MRHQEYVRTLRPQLPAVAFRPRPDQLWFVVAASAVLIGGTLLIREDPPLWIRPIHAFAIGMAVASIGFQAHDLSHGQIIGDPKLRYAAELYVWGLGGFPPTLWHRLHNVHHHRAPNGIDDPDRRFVEDERNRASAIYTAAFFPSRGRPRWRPLVSLGAVYPAHVAKNLWNAFRGPDSAAAPLLTARPVFETGDKVRIAAELVPIAIIHGALFAMVGFDPARYLWSGVLPFSFAVALNVRYIYTQHALRRFGSEGDPLAVTTSLSVSRIVDKLHHNVSHHTEHHLFPTMSSVYYPLVRRLLIEQHADRFHLVTSREAYRELWRAAPFASWSDPPPDPATRAG